MNTITTNSFASVAKEENRDFTIEITDNMVASFQQDKQFTVAEMWNLQRRSRTMLQRRRNAYLRIKQHQKHLKYTVMKKSTTLVFNNIEGENFSQLTHIVDETLAVLPAEPRKFTTVDLWRIQRSYRTSFTKRYN